MAAHKPNQSKPRAVSRPARRDLLAALLFGLLAALYYGPVLAGARAFPFGDFTDHFFPFILYQYESLRGLVLPVWNPYTYSGHPFLADVQAAVYYPLSNLLLMATWGLDDPAARFYWLQVEVVVQVALGGWFAYLWTRDLTGSRWAGLVGGIAWAWSGYLNGYAPLQLAVLRTAIWIPLLWWLLGRGWLRPDQFRWWIGGSVVLATAFLAGHSQTFLLLVYGTGAWLLVLMAVHRRRFLHRAAMLLATLLCAAALTAAQWLPSFEFVVPSVRAQVDYAFVAGGFGWADLWQILLPGVLTQFSPIYIGGVGVALAILALSAWVARPLGLDSTRGTPLLPWRVGVAFCALLALVAWLVALGGNGPLYELFYRFVPGWAWFRGQERAAVLVTLALCGLAGQGMGLIERMPSFVRRRGIVLAAGVVLATTYAFGLLRQLTGQSVVNHAEYLVIAALTLIFVLTAAVIIALPEWSHRRAALLAALVALSLVWPNLLVNQQPGTPATRVLLAPEVAAVAAALAVESASTTTLPPRVYNESRVPEDYGMRVHVEDVWGSSPLRLARYAALFDEFPLDRMWRLLGVEYVLTWRRELFGPSEVLAEFPQATDTTYLHRLLDAAPRAWIVGNVQVASDEDALRLLADHQFDVDVHALVGTETTWPTPVISLGSVDVDVTRLRADTLRVRAATGQGGFLVLAETWMDGWETIHRLCDDVPVCPQSDVEGRPYLTPVRANLTQVGLWLPPGDTEFDLAYRPQSVRVGLWISGAALVFLVAVTLTLGALRVRRA